jgi:hypothetical protein
MNLEIQSGDLKQNIIDAAKITVPRGIPNKLSEFVIPVINVNPRHCRYTKVLKSAQYINNTGGTLLATPASTERRRFYMTGCSLQYIKDATSTSIYVQILANVGGVNSILCHLPEITLTAGNAQISQVFTPPILIDNGSNITAACSTNVANHTFSAIIWGYYEDIM